MKVTGLLRALAIAACIVLAAPPGGANEARDLVAKGRFDAALAMLRPLARDPAPHTDVRFLLGLAAIGASQARGISEDERDALLDEAIAALRSILVRRPALMRVRLELARAFFRKGEDGLARQHFERVLASGPPARVAHNVNRFLDAIRARKRWSLSVGAALLPDSNIGSGSTERVIFINGLPFRRDADELTTSGIGVSAWLGGEYQYPLSERWRLRLGGDLSRRDYEASAFDETTLKGRLGPRWLIGRAGEISLLLSGLRHWTGSGLEEPSHHDIGLRVQGRARLGRQITANARASWHRRNHDRQDRRDGSTVEASFGTRWVASPTVRIDWTLGWSRERTEARHWRNSRFWARLGATATLPWGFTVGGSGMLRRTGWEGDWFPFTPPGRARSDLTRTIRLFAHNRALTLEGFSPQLSVTQESRSTNAQLHDYRRVSGELRFVRLF